MSDDEPLFDSAERVDEALSAHLERDFTPLSASELRDQYSTEDFEELGGLLAESSKYQIPIVWLFEQEGRRILLDHALREFYKGPDQEDLSKAELGRAAGTSRQTVSEYIDDLATVGIYKTRGDGRTLYRVDEESVILQQLAEVNNSLMQVADRTNGSL